MCDEGSVCESGFDLERGGSGVIPFDRCRLFAGVCQQCCGLVKDLTTPWYEEAVDIDKSKKFSQLGQCGRLRKVQDNTDLCERTHPMAVNLVLEELKIESSLQIDVLQG